MKVTAGLLALFMFCFYVLLCVGCVGLSVYGVYLAFCASVILGLIMLVVCPSFTIVGAVMFFFKVNIPVLIMHWLNAHGQ